MQLFWMSISGLLFAIFYLTLRGSFDNSNLLSGLIVSRLAAAIIVSTFILAPNLRNQIFHPHKDSGLSSRRTGVLLVFGESMGALSGLLLIWGVALASPALVNSLFGVQYLVILGAALILSGKHPQLLDENLSKGILAQKIIGAGILSWGVYLLSK